MRAFTTSLALSALLTGCTSPFWHTTAHEQFEYKGYIMNVASQYRVGMGCGVPFIVNGCTDYEDPVAWSVPNFYTLRHECGHIEAFANGGTLGEEWGKDLAVTLTGFNDIAIITTELFPVSRTCGEGSIPITTFEHCMRVAGESAEAQRSCESRFM